MKHNPQWVHQRKAFLELHHLLAFNLALFAAIASPGPALLVAIKTTLSSGKGAGIQIGLGLGLIAAMWTGVALIGLDVIFRTFPWIYNAVTIIGAAYLAFIAYQTWRGATDPIRDNSDAPTNAFRDGVILNLSNPKSVLFAAAVLIAIFPAGMSLAAKSLVIINHFLVEVIFYVCLATLMGGVAIRNRYLSLKLYLDRFAAIVLFALAARIFISIF